MPDFRGFITTHPVLTGIATVAGLVLILADWKAFFLLASLVALVAGLAMLAMLAIDSRQHRRQEKAEIAARADDQHEALLHGDDKWGVFGIRPPAEPAVEESPSPRKSTHLSLVAGVGLVAGIVIFAVLATVNAFSANQPPRPASAPTVTPIPSASRPAPRSVNPTPAAVIPSPTIPAPLPAPTSPPTQPAGPPVQLGQKAVDGNVTFVVTSVDRSKTAANPSVPFMQTTAKGTFLTTRLAITNNGKQPELFITSYQKLRIASGVYEVDPIAALWTMTLETVVSPGATAMAALSFDVPADTPSGGILELHGSSKSPGAEVELLPPQ